MYAGLSKFLLSDVDHRTEAYTREVNQTVVALAMSSCLIIIITIVLVKVKTKSTNSSKFKSMFKNVNVILVLVVLVSALLYQLATTLDLPPGLVFPMFLLGLDMVATLAAFLTTNTEARAFLSRKLGRDTDQVERGTETRGRRGVRSQEQGVKGPTLSLEHRNRIEPGRQGEEPGEGEEGRNQEQRVRGPALSLEHRNRIEPVRQGQEPGEGEEVRRQDLRVRGPAFSLEHRNRIEPVRQAQEPGEGEEVRSQEQRLGADHEYN